MQVLFMPQGSFVHDNFSVQPGFVRHKDLPNEEVIFKFVAY
jgi:hypothetical protein